MSPASSEPRGRGDVHPNADGSRRVLMISSLWPPRVMGGAELYAAALAQQLRERGSEVGVVTLGVSGPEVVEAIPPFGYSLDQYATQGLARRGLFHVADLYRFRTRQRVADAIREFRPSVVHTHAVMGLSTAALTTPTALGIAHVHTIHDYWLVCQRAIRMHRDGTPCESICQSCALWSGARKALMGRHHPSIVLVGSHAAAGEHAGVSWMAGRTRVVPPPVPNAVPRRRRDDGPVTFGYLGRLDQAKGVLTLVEAFAHSSADARLLVGGTGPLEHELTRQRPARVELLGWLDEERKEQFFQDIDCLVVPSEWPELAGLVVLEARARRVPVIGARSGGIPEMVPDESRPLLFQPGDVAELAGRLELVASSPLRYAGSAASARSTWPGHVDAIETAYADAATSRRVIGAAP